MSALYASVVYKKRKLNVCLGDLARWFGVDGVTRWVNGKQRLALRAAEFKQEQGVVVCSLCGRKIGAVKKAKPAKRRAVKRRGIQKKKITPQLPPPTAPAPAAAPDKSWRDMTKRERKAYLAKTEGPARKGRVKMRRGRYAGAARRRDAKKYSSAASRARAPEIEGAKTLYHGRIADATRAKREREFYDDWAAGEFEERNLAEYQAAALERSPRDLRAWYLARAWHEQLVPPRMRNFTITGPDYFEPDIMDPADLTLERGDAYEGDLVEAPASAAGEFAVPF